MSWSWLNLILMKPLLEEDGEEILLSLGVLPDLCTTGCTAPPPPNPACLWGPAAAANGGAGMYTLSLACTRDGQFHF